MKLTFNEISMAPDLNDYSPVHPATIFSETDSKQNEMVWQKLRREVKAISLDLWGTILDDKQSPSDTILYSERRQDFMREELARCGHHITAEQMRDAYKAAWQHFDDLWGKQIAFGAAEGLRAMLRALNADLPPESFAHVEQYFEEAYQDPAPLEGTIDAVQRLAGKYPLALISDTAWTPGRVLRQIFTRYEILDCFSALIFSGEVGKTKPHPQMFQLALDGLGVQPQECLHLGDLQHTDIAGANAAGMHTAWIHRPVYAGEEQRDFKPTVIVKGVKEVAEKLL